MAGVGGIDECQQRCVAHPVPPSHRADVRGAETTAGAPAAGDPAEDGAAVPARGEAMRRHAGGGAGAAHRRPHLKARRRGEGEAKRGGDREACVRDSPIRAQREAHWGTRGREDEKREERGAGNEKGEVAEHC